MVACLGPVGQSIVSLTGLRRQFVGYMQTTLSDTLLFFIGKLCRKNQHICNIYVLTFYVTLTYDVVNDKKNLSLFTES